MGSWPLRLPAPSRVGASSSGARIITPICGLASRVWAELGVEPAWLPWFSTCALPEAVVARLHPEFARPRVPETLAATFSALLACDYVVTDCYSRSSHTDLAPGL